MVCKGIKLDFFQFFCFCFSLYLLIQSLFMKKTKKIRDSTQLFVLYSSFTTASFILNTKDSWEKNVEEDGLLI